MDAARLRALNFMTMVMKDNQNIRNFVVPHLNQVMGMIEKNIFRPLPYIEKYGDADFDKEEEIDPSWSHI